MGVTLGVGLAAIAVFALLGGATCFFLSSSSDVGPMTLDSSAIGAASSQSGLKGATRSDADVSSTITATSIEPMSPEKIVDQWLQLREASEEGQRVKVVEKGTPEYEERVQRFIEGEKRSRELLRIALVSPTGDTALQVSMAERNGVFLDQYKYGTGNKHMRFGGDQSMSAG